MLQIWDKCESSSLSYLINFFFFSTSPYFPSQLWTNRNQKGKQHFLKCTQILQHMYVHEASIIFTYAFNTSLKESNRVCTCLFLSTAQQTVAVLKRTGQINYQIYTKENIKVKKHGSRGKTLNLIILRTLHHSNLTS